MSMCVCVCVCIHIYICMCFCVYICMLSCFSHVRLFATPWTVATRLLCPWDSPVKNTGIGCPALLQGIFPTQGSNPHLPWLLHCRQILYRWAAQGSPPSLLSVAPLPHPTSLGHHRAPELSSLCSIATYTEWGKSEREKQIPYVNTYIWNLEKMVLMNLFSGQEWRCRCIEWTCGSFFCCGAQTLARGLQ